MRLIVTAWLALVALVPGAAMAEWHEASSAHFVVYADDSESRVRAFSQQLERYHSALEIVTSTKPAPPSPSNRVTVYVVGSVNQVRKLAGGKSQSVAGFYVSRAGSSLAVVPRISLGTDESGSLDFSMTILLHEYTHHFMISKSAYAMPPWVTEGAAEFFSSASFERDGSVGIGRPAHHRAGELFFARDTTVRQLLDPLEYDRRRAKGAFESYYGRAWLLYHYLTLGGTRKGELQRYLLAVNRGKGSLEAGTEVFGDLGKLDREVDGYLEKRRIMMLKLPPTMLTVAPVRLRRLGEGEAAIMPLVVRSRRGVDRAMAAEVVLEARAIAARYPSDPAVLAELAEAEYDAGNDSAAIAAADRALVVDPKRVNAYVQKGYALFRQAATGGDPSAFAKARAPFVALNRLENDHPLALFHYYRSFAMTGGKPPKLAVDGLQRAVEVAPFDLGLRMTLAMHDLREGRPDWAKANLSPVAYNPHAGSLAQMAREAINRIDADPNWRGEGAENLDPRERGNEEPAQPS